MLTRVALDAAPPGEANELIIPTMTSVMPSLVLETVFMTTLVLVRSGRHGGCSLSRPIEIYHHEFSNLKHLTYGIAQTLQVTNSAQLSTAMLRSSLIKQTGICVVLRA